MDVGARQAQQQQIDEVACPECGGRMELCFILDMMQGAIWPQKWTKDAPKKSWWGGMKVNWDQCRAVETHRCLSCVKLYGSDERAGISVDAHLPKGEKA